MKNIKVQVIERAKDVDRLTFDDEFSDKPRPSIEELERIASEHGLTIRVIEPPIYRLISDDGSVRVYAVERPADTEEVIGS